jgi:hypothetical protein
MPKNKPLNLSNLSVKEIAHAMLTTKPIPRPVKKRKKK